MVDRSSAEPRYPVRVVTHRTGVSADALRAWERRYGAVQPGRSAGGQRLYSEDDVARLALMHRATAAGHRIAEIARLDVPALEALFEGDARRATSERVEEIDALVTTALAATERLDAPAVEAALRRGALALDGTALVDRVVPAFLRTVGDRWHEGALHPAQEHLASAAVRRVLAWIADAYTAAPRAPRLVVTTPAGELHELGALLVATAAAEEGWSVVYLGPNLPHEDVLRAARQSGARAIALSVVHDSNDPLHAVTCIARGLPPQVALLVGGAAAQSHVEALEAHGARVLGDIPVLRRVLRALRASTRVRPGETGD